MDSPIPVTGEAEWRKRPTTPEKVTPLTPVPNQDDFPEVVGPDHYHSKEAPYPPATTTASVATSRGTWRERLSRRTLVLLIVAAILILGAIIGGSVGGTIGKQKSNAEAAASGGSPSGVENGGTPGVSVLSSSKLAAVRHSSATCTSVFFQVENATVLVTSKCGEDSKGWSRPVNVGANLDLKAKPGTSLASIEQKRPSANESKIWLFYQDVDDNMRDVVADYPSLAVGNWRKGDLGLSDYKAAPKAEISACWYNWADFDEILVAFVKDNKTLHVWNSTDKTATLVQPLGSELAEDVGVSIVLENYWGGPKGGKLDGMRLVTDIDGKLDTSYYDPEKRAPDRGRWKPGHAYIKGGSDPVQLPNPPSILATVPFNDTANDQIAVTLIQLDSKGSLRSYWTSPPNEKNWTALDGSKADVTLSVQNLKVSALATASDFDTGFQRAFTLSNGQIHEFNVVRGKDNVGTWPVVGSVTWK